MEKMDEEDRLVTEEEDGFYRDDHLASRRKRRIIGALLMCGFFIVVAIAVSLNQIAIWKDKAGLDSAKNSDPIESVFIEEPGDGEGSGDNYVDEDDYRPTPRATEKPPPPETKTSSGEETDNDKEDAVEDVQQDYFEKGNEEAEAAMTDDEDSDRTPGEAQVTDPPHETETPEVDEPVKPEEETQSDESDIYSDGGNEETEGEEEESSSGTGVINTTADHVESIWDLNLNRLGQSKNSKPNLNPELIFVKGIKVGSTSVALALNHAAAAYKIKLIPVAFERNKNFNYKLVTCAEMKGGSLYFRHGYRNPWGRQCLSNVKHTTVLRDPVSQELSYEAYILNQEYFKRYPMEPCAKAQFIDARARLSEEELQRRLATVTTCNDTPYRRNLTIIHTANQIRELKQTYPGRAVAWTATWVAAVQHYGDLTSASMIDQLANQFFLVGVTERINEYLVLLAVVNGWELKNMYYEKCKSSNLDVPRKEFEQYFPELIAKLQDSTTVMDEAHQWAQREFDEHVSKLGPWFKEKVRRYEEGLREFQASKRPDPKNFQWRMMRYADGRPDLC